MTVDDLVYELTNPELDHEGRLRVDLSNASIQADALNRAVARAAELGALRQVQSLDLSNTGLTNNGVHPVAESYRQLQSLSLQGCDQVTDAGVRSVANNCRQLLSLNLNGTQVTGEGLWTTDIRAPLQHLYLNGTRVTDRGVQEVAAHCRQLLTLSLHGCNRVTDEGVRAVGMGCPQLQTLHLSWTTVTDAGVREAALRCRQLRHLFLTGVNVVSVDPAILKTNDARQISAALLRGVVLPVARIQFLGSGNVGKTWLFERCFLDRCVERNRPRVQTPDIDLIRPEQCVWVPTLRTPESEQEVEPRVWDFGGQLVLHGVHETFLGDDGRTIYVLVLSAKKTQASVPKDREEVGNAVAYWRRMIAHFGSDTAPVVAAVTQCDDVKNAPRPIDNPVPIGQALSDVTLVDDLSATNSDKPIQPLRDAIEAALAQRPGIREAKVSRELVAVREVVERELPEVALVPVATFGMWCRECGVPDDQADAIRDILHYMGSLFYFGRDRLDRERDRDLAPGQRRLHERRPDTVLSKFIINPVWLKHAAYKVFEESERSEWLDRHKLQAKVVAADARCKGHKRGGDVIEAFLELVELSFYDEEKQQYLLPRGLKIGRPPGFDHWPAARLYWDFVPESAFHRFVVRMHHGKQVEKMGGGYAHGRDWVMVLYRQCRLVVSADTVNGVVEIRFNPESISNDWPEAFTIIRHEFAQYLICKPPMRVEGIEQSGESEEHRALRALVEQAKESDWVNVGVASSRTGMAEPTLKDATYPKHGRSRNPGQYLRLDDTCGIVGGRTKVGYVWRKVGKKYQFLSSSLSDWGHRGC